MVDDDEKGKFAKKSADYQLVINETSLDVSCNYEYWNNNGCEQIKRFICSWQNFFIAYEN